MYENIKEPYKVTIGVPIYGVENFIERCARSLFEQTYDNIEYVFVNDCTKDRSVEILNKVLEAYPNRKNQVKILNHEKNRGLAAARNTAVENATGKFLMWVDSDDYVDVQIVRKTIDRQVECNADIVTSGARKIKENGSESLIESDYDSVADNVVAILQRKAQIRVWGRLIRRSIYIENSIRAEEGVNMGEDFQVVPLLCFYSKRICSVRDELYFYDCSNEGSYSNNFSKAKHEQSLRSFDLVKSFFANKGDEYLWALKKGELVVIIAHLIISEKTGLDFYYLEAVRRLRCIEKRYWNYLPLTKRMILHLSKHRCLMNKFISILRKINMVVSRKKQG